MMFALSTRNIKADSVLVRQLQLDTLVPKISQVIIRARNLTIFCLEVFQNIPVYE